MGSHAARSPMDAFTVALSIGLAAWIATGAYRVHLDEVERERAWRTGQPPAA